MVEPLPDIPISLTSDFLEMLLKASQEVENAASVEKMLRQIVESVLVLIPADAAAVALLESGRSWVRVVSAGEAATAFEGYRLRQDEIKGLLEVALLDERTTTKDDCMADEYADIYRIARLGCGVAVPLRRQGHVIGVVGVFRQVPERTMFKPHECKLLELFGAQVGPVLASAYRINELETALKSRDEFLSIASHDLRNPLTALRGFSQLTIRSIDRVPEDKPVPRGPLLANLQRIVKQSNSLDKLIGKLLDVSRINTNRLEIQPVALNLSELVLDTARRCIVAVTTTESEANLPNDRRHTMQLDVTPDEVWGMFDRERIEQLITNLMDNAVKYSPEGGRVTISLNQVAPGDTAELRVSDQGIGIPEDKQMIIFNRWSRVYSSREGEIGEVNGLGLGLFICREIVRRHSGQIKLESEPGQGSIFIVTLPLKLETAG